MKKNSNESSKTASLKENLNDAVKSVGSSVSTATDKAKTAVVKSKHSIIGTVTVKSI